MAGDIRTRIVIDADAGAAVKALDAVDDAAGRADRSIDDIADRVDVDTRRATGNLDDVERAAGDAERAVRDVDGTDVTIDADTSDVVAAESDVKELRDLARDPVRVTVDVDAESMDRVRRVGDDVKTVGVNAEGLQRGVGPLRGFTDELGGAAGTAGTAANALIDAGEAVEIFGAQLGLSQTALSRVSLGLGGIGLAVGAATFAWSKYREAQEKARERAEELLGVQEQLADGKYREAAEKLTDTYGDLFADLAAQGVDAATAVRVLNGDLETTLDTLSESANAGDQLAAGTVKLADGFAEIDVASAAALLKLRDDFAAAGVELAGTTATTDALERALRGTGDTATDAARDVDKVTDAFADLRREMDNDRAILDVADAFDRVEDAAITAWSAAVEGTDDAETSARDYERSILDAKTDVLDLVEALGDVPPEQVAEIIADIDQGSFDTAETKLNDITRDRTVRATIETLFRVPQVPYFVRPSGTSTAPTSTVVNQTINVRATPAMRDVDAAAARWRRIESGH